MEGFFPEKKHDHAYNDPPCELTEKEDHLPLTLDVPGIKKKDLNIEVVGKDIVISGSRKTLSKTQSSSERWYGSFKRKYIMLHN